MSFVTIGHNVWYIIKIIALMSVLSIVLIVGGIIWYIYYPGPSYTNIASKSITDIHKTVLAYEFNSRRDQLVYVTGQVTTNFQTVEVYYWNSITNQSVHLATLANIYFDEGRFYNEIGRAILSTNNNEFIILFRDEYATPRIDEALYIDAMRNVKRFRVIHNSTDHKEVEAIAQQFLKQDNVSRLMSINGYLLIPLSEQTIVYCCLNKSLVPYDSEKKRMYPSVQAILSITTSRPIIDVTFFNKQYSERNIFEPQTDELTAKREFYGCNYISCKYIKHRIQTENHTYIFSLSPYVPFSRFFTLASGQLVWFEDGQLYILP